MSTPETPLSPVHARVLHTQRSRGLIATPPPLVGNLARAANDNLAVNEGEKKGDRFSTPTTKNLQKSGAVSSPAGQTPHKLMAHVDAILHEMHSSDVRKETVSVEVQTDEESLWRINLDNTNRLRQHGFTTIEDVQAAIAREKQEISLITKQSREAEAAAIARVETYRVRLETAKRTLNLKQEQFKQFRQEKIDELLRVAEQIQKFEQTLVEDAKSVRAHRQQINSFRERLRRLTPADLPGGTDAGLPQFTNDFIERGDSAMFRHIHR